MRRPTAKRRQPIPGLAEAIAGFTGVKAKKRATAEFLSATADRIYALAVPKVRERL